MHALRDLGVQVAWQWTAGVSRRQRPSAERVSVHGEGLERAASPAKQPQGCKVGAGGLCQAIKSGGEGGSRAGHSRGAGRQDDGRGCAAVRGTQGIMKANGSALLNASQQAPGGGESEQPRPSWLASTLAFILIFTIVVDILGNLLVILSVYRNKKLRNAGRGFQHLSQT